MKSNLSSNNHIQKKFQSVQLPALLRNSLNSTRNPRKYQCSICFSTVQQQGNLRNLIPTKCYLSTFEALGLFSWHYKRPIRFPTPEYLKTVTYDDFLLTPSTIRMALKNHTLHHSMNSLINNPTNRHEEGPCKSYSKTTPGTPPTLIFSS